MTSTTPARPFGAERGSLEGFAIAKKLFGATIEPSCATCEHGSVAQDGHAVLCPRRGIVRLDYRCRKYRYDPLRRLPNILPAPRTYDRSEFEL